MRSKDIHHVLQSLSLIVSLPFYEITVQVDIVIIIFTSNLQKIDLMGKQHIYMGINVLFTYFGTLSFVRTNYASMKRCSIMYKSIYEGYKML